MVENCDFFHTTLAFDASIGGGGGLCQNILIPFGVEKLEWWDYPMAKKTLRICVTVYTQYRYVTDGWRDGETDRQTSCHGIVRAMQWRRAVKTHEAQLPQTNCATMVNDPKNVAMFPAQIHCIFIF